MRYDIDTAYKCSSHWVSEILEHRPRKVALDNTYKNNCVVEGLARVVRMVLGDVPDILDPLFNAWT